MAKNLFLSPERTIQRKVHEAFLALWIEARLSKQEILKLYLDRSYLGGGNYGVEAAAQYYFGKSIRDVNLSEAAMLAGLFKAPTKYAPHQNIEACKGARQCRALPHARCGLHHPGRTSAGTARTAAGDCAAQSRQPRLVPRLGLRAKRIALLEEQHLLSDYVIEVKTTVDVKLQAAAQKILNEVIDTEGPAYRFTQAASVTMTPEGAVKAIVGGRNYESSQFNRATDAERQTGSAFKPFVYLAALLDGYTPDRMVVDAPGLGWRLVARKLFRQIWRARHAHDRARQVLQFGSGQADGRYRQARHHQDGP